MNNENESKTTPKKQMEVTVPTRWPENVDLPTIYANQFFITHAGLEFFLIFGEVTAPLWTEPTAEKLEALEALQVKPVAKIAIPYEVMRGIAQIIQANVEGFLAKKAKGEEKEGK